MRARALALPASVVLSAPGAQLQSGSYGPRPVPCLPDAECSQGNLTDFAPSADFSCAERAAWGQCGEGFMPGYCSFSCFKCDAECGSNACKSSRAW